MKVEFLDSHGFWNHTKVKLCHEHIFSPSRKYPENSVKIPYEFNMILGDIISLDFAEKPYYYGYKSILKSMILDYNLISTKIVKNFREQAKS